VVPEFRFDACHGSDKDVVSVPTILTKTAVDWYQENLLYFNPSGLVRDLGDAGREKCEAWGGLEWPCVWRITTSPPERTPELTDGKTLSCALRVKRAYNQIIFPNPYAHGFSVTSVNLWNASPHIRGVLPNSRSYSGSKVYVSNFSTRMV